VTLAVTTLALGTGAVIDALTRRIPNVLTLATAALGVVLAASGITHVSLAQSLLGFLLGMLLMLPAHLLGATGAGDVKLLGAAGAILGVQRVPVAFVYMAIAGGLLAVLVALRRGRLADTLRGAALVVAHPRAGRAAIEKRGREDFHFFPYGPAIAIGCVLAALGI